MGPACHDGPLYRVLNITAVYCRIFLMLTAAYFTGGWAVDETSLLTAHFVPRRPCPGPLLAPQCHTAPHLVSPEQPCSQAERTATSSPGTSVLCGCWDRGAGAAPYGPVCGAPGSCSGRREAGGSRKAFRLQKEGDIQQKLYKSLFNFKCEQYSKRLVGVAMRTYSLVWETSLRKSHLSWNHKVERDLAR